MMSHIYVIRDYYGQIHAHNLTGQDCIVWSAPCNLEIVSAVYIVLVRFLVFIGVLIWFSWVLRPLL